MATISTGELEVAIDLGEPGDRAAFVDMLVELFGASDYLLSDIALGDGGRFVDLYIEAAMQDGFIQVEPFVMWLEGIVAGILEGSDARTASP